jgi:hypothetical protein
MVLARVERRYRVEVEPGHMIGENLLLLDQVEFSKYRDGRFEGSF